MKEKFFIISVLYILFTRLDFTSNFSCTSAKFPSRLTPQRITSRLTQDSSNALCWPYLEQVKTRCINLFVFTVFTGSSILFSNCVLNTLIVTRQEQPCEYSVWCALFCFYRLCGLLHCSLCIGLPEGHWSGSLNQFGCLYKSVWTLEAIQGRKHQPLFQARGSML